MIPMDAVEVTIVMRWVIPGVTLTALGFQIGRSCFLVSILGLKKR